MKELFMLKKIAYDDTDLKVIDNGIHWLCSANIDHTWEDDDSWLYPREFIFRFVNKENMTLFKLLFGGKRINLYFTKEST